jgi:hypothetical protein
LYVYHRVSGSSGVFFPYFLGESVSDLIWTLSPIFWKLFLTQMLHGAGICTPIFTPKMAQFCRCAYSSTMVRTWVILNWLKPWTHHPFQHHHYQLAPYKFHFPQGASSLGSVVHNHGIRHCLVGYPHLWIISADNNEMVWLNMKNGIYRDLPSKMATNWDNTQT